MHRPMTSRGTKHKAAKGHNMLRAQNRKAMERRRALKAVKLKKRNIIPESLRKKWAELHRWFTLSKYLKGKHTPHQGIQECARRVRQRIECKCIHPRREDERKAA